MTYLVYHVFFEKPEIALLAFHERPQNLRSFGERPQKLGWLEYQGFMNMYEFIKQIWLLQQYLLAQGLGGSGCDCHSEICRIRNCTVCVCLLAGTSSAFS